MEEKSYNSEEFEKWAYDITSKPFFNRIIKRLKDFKSIVLREQTQKFLDKFDMNKILSIEEINFLIENTETRLLLANWGAIKKSIEQKKLDIIKEKIKMLM